MPTTRASSVITLGLTSPIVIHQLSSKEIHTTVAIRIYLRFSGFECSSIRAWASRFTVPVFFAIVNRLVFIFKLFYLFFSVRSYQYLYSNIFLCIYYLYALSFIYLAIFYRKYNILTISKYGNTLWMVIAVSTYFLSR